MIDWWLFILFNMLVLTLAFHTYLGYFISNANKGLQNGNQIKVRPINYDNGKEDAEMTKEKVLIRAIWLNRIGNILFVVFMIIFNIIFWIVAFLEHLRPGEEYINN